MRAHGAPQVLHCDNGPEFTGLDFARGEPNAVWAADFKGHFKLHTGAECYPLTIGDGFSRDLPRCEALRHPDHLSAREVVDAALTEFGLP